MSVMMVIVLNNITSTSDSRLSILTAGHTITGAAAALWIVDQQPGPGQRQVMMIPIPGASGTRDELTAGSSREDVMFVDVWLRNRGLGLSSLVAAGQTI